LGVLFLTIFLDLVGFGILIPIQPFYAQLFGASPFWITLLGASYSLMQFLFAPFWGGLSDRVGRRPVLLVSIAIGAVGYAWFGIAGSLPMLFAARMLSGFGNANIATAQAMIADVTDASNRARGMGLIGAAFGLGFILGPAIGGYFSQFGLHWPAWVAGGLGALNFVLAWFILPETNRPVAGATIQRRRPLRDLANAVKKPVMGPVLASLFLMTMGFAVMEQVIGLLIERTYVAGRPGGPAVGSTEAATEAALRVTWFLLVVGVVATLVQGRLIGPLVKRYGEPRLALAGQLLLAGSIVLLPVMAATGPWWGMLVLAGGLAAGSGLATPSLNGLLSRVTATGNQGASLGQGQAASALGRVVGPACSGALFQLTMGLPFFVGAGLLLLATGGTWLAWRRWRPVEAA